MNLQFHMQTQANASGDFLSFHGRSNPQSPISTLGFRSSALRQPLLPLLSHKSDAKRPIPLLRVRVVAEHSVDGNLSADSSPAKALRRILTSLGIQQCPACFDALSAKLVERAGFRCCFTSGFSISGARLGLPDAGLISYGEMLDQGRQITEAVSIPVIGDADNGYGNAMNVKRTVNGYIKAGFAGIMLEDQVSPKACGHTQGRKVVSREEAVMRIRAAIDARKECGSDIVILARTDSRQALSFEEALWRTKALADAGADVLFIDALTSKQEMKAFCETAPLVPKLATMLEGGGKIPILDLSELEDVGYKLVAYPLSLIGVSILAMQNALNAIRSGYIPSPGSMPSFEKIKEILGFNRYYEEEKRYATSTSQSPSQSVSSSGYGVQHSATDDAEKKEGVPRHPRVDGQRVYSSRIESRKLRIKTTGRDGIEKINATIPAGGNLEGLTKFIPGFSISAARLGLPDTGLISYGEMVEQGRLITEAVSIPVIGDGDNGYGNALNVKRTVKGYIRAGFAGIILEDQVSPKACGHTQGRKTVSREEAVMRIKAAVDARKESGSDIVIVARSDSRQAISFDESLWRSRAFADAGADVLFIDALTSREEMKAFCEIAPQVPKMASMLEGGGKTPILNLLELEEIGYKIVAYPLSLLGVSIQAMKDALVAIKGGRIPPPGSMPSFEEIKEILGFNNYYEEEKRYATSKSSSGQLSSQRVSSRVYDIEKRTQDNAEQRDRSPEGPVVEVITPDVYNSGADGSRDPFSGIWARTLRVKITGKDGFEKLDVRIPAGFLEGVTNIVPALGGVNLKQLLDDAAYEPGGKLLLDFNDSIGDSIQVFLE